MNKKPPELHLIEGTIPNKNSPKRERPVLLPNSVKKRIPRAEWLDNPELWDKNKFIEETADFLYNVYGIGNEQDKHVLGILADHIDTYIHCTKHIQKNTLMVRINNGSPGPNPLLTVRAKTTQLILQLMNELGLTPRGRLSANKTEDDSPLAKLMRGPKG